MAKSKEQKYKEAVIRNVTSAAQYIGWLNTHRGTIHMPCIDPLLRSKFGIRPYDTQFDELITKEITRNLSKENATS